MTDEDQQIARLKIHRDIIGWLIKELKNERIKAERTIGASSKGDILITTNKKSKLKEVMYLIEERFNQVQEYKQISRDVESETTNTLYIEVKAYTTTSIGSALANKIIAKETVVAVVTTGKIYQPAKDLLDAADIIWIEFFPESELTETEDQEEG